MAWTEFTRPRYERSGGRYASDASDAEWALVAPLMPAPRKVGRPINRLCEKKEAKLYSFSHLSTTFSSERPSRARGYACPRYFFPSFSVRCA